MAGQLASALPGYLFFSALGAIRPIGWTSPCAMEKVYVPLVLLLLLLLLLLCTNYNCNYNYNYNNNHYYYY